MSEPQARYVLACHNPPSIWDFYLTAENAAAKIDEANKRAILGNPPYRVMTYEAYKLIERAFWIDGKEIQITAGRYMEMLEVLPPMAWHSGFEFESFLMCEFMSGSFTEQYIRRGTGDTAQYFCKMVDVCDRSTWAK